MTISKLYIFSKDTDANASLRGYQFQILKALQTWVENYINSVDEEIYCDYEDDIFQKDRIGKGAVFRQLKLYSTNFSFKSEEIEKCISHFFMLHVKTNYLNSEKQFIFETNSSIAARYLDNDADLLRQWNDNQDNLPDNLLKQCSDKIKQVVTTYINDQALKLKDKIPEETIQEAQSVFQNLQEEDWLNFAKTIRWKFAGNNPEDEFSNTIHKVEESLLNLPFSVDDQNLRQIFGLLYKEVSLKSSQENPEKRKLNNSDLKYLLLNSGSSGDKWYLEILGKWKPVTTIDFFHIGEFFEVLNAAKYCRRRKYLSADDSQWGTLLEIFIYKLPIREEFRRNAIYELAWLKFRPDGEYKLPTGDLFECDDLIKSYFENFDDFGSADELEDVQSLLHIVSTAMMMGKTTIALEQIKQWHKRLYKTLQKNLNKTKDLNEKCHLLEELATFTFYLYQIRRKKSTPKIIVSYYDQILQIIDGAPYYHATTLSGRINRYINLLISLEPNEHADLINTFETFSEKLDPIVQKRDGKYNSAKKQVERGAILLKSKNSTLLLSALNYFHKAKDLWNQQETIEGHVLALLNISQLYLAIGMNFASKYYAICAFWVSVNNGDKVLLKRISDSLSLVFASDFKGGSWMSAILAYEEFIRARYEFNPAPVDNDESLHKSFLSYALILFAMPKLSLQFGVFADSKLKALGDLQETFESIFEELNRGFSDEAELIKLIERKIDEYPLNDVGRQRVVQFNAIGCLWRISFSNNHETTSVAEEFCSILQIMLAEIALSKVDFHLLSGVIDIQLEVSTEFRPPEPMPSNEEYKWKVFTTYFDSPENMNFNIGSKSAILLKILNELSVLPFEEFETAFYNLFQEHDLASKTFYTNAYQRMYRFMFDKKYFDSVQREFFTKVDIAMPLPKTNKIMRWNFELSPKYDQQRAISFIKNRYKNAYKCIHITLDRLKSDTRFVTLINELRLEGWLDWQITLAIMNYIINSKVHAELATKNLLSEDGYLSEMQKGMAKYLNMDEKDCYVEFIFEDFASEEFRKNVPSYAMYVLQTYGLENKSRTPNLKAIKIFLDTKFKMAEDNTDEGNPLKDIA